MKRFFSIISAVAMILAIASCTPKPVPDGKAALQSISFQKAANSSLSADIKGTIEGNTVSFTLPVAVVGTKLVPTFTATEHDVVKIGGVVAESGVTACTIEDGTKIVVSDEVSALETTYTIAVTEDDGVAELLSLTLLKSDKLPEDIAVDQIAEQMLVRVPASAFQQTLTLKATAGKNDIIKINGEVAKDGTASVDTKFPIDIQVVDNGAGKSVSYVLKVGKILESVWTLAGTYTNDKVDAYVALAVDAAADVPYMAISETDYGTDGKAVTKNRPTTLKYADGAISVVGQSQYLETAVTYSCIDVMNGVPYVSFVDAGAATKNRVSCVAYKDGNWDFVGERGFGFKITGLSYYRIDMILNPANKQPMVALTSNEAGTGIAKRDLAVSAFNGSAWDANKPVTGRTQNYCYNEKFARSADAVYLLAANQTEKTFSLYQYKDGAWSVLVADLTIAGTSDICTYFADLSCDSKGNVYAAIGDNSSGNYVCQLYKYDGTALVKAGNPVPNAYFDDTKCQWSLTFDKDDNPVLAYINVPAEGQPRTAKVVAIDPETKNWGEATDFGEATETYISAGRADNGNLYVAYSTTSNKINTIVLRKFSLEKDVIPE